MVEPSWETREKPILRAIVDAEENGQDVIQAARSAVEIDDRAYMLCIDRLCRAGYIDAEVVRLGSGEIGFALVNGSEPKALAEVGLWPRPDSLRALVELFERLAERESDQQRKGLFRSAAGALRGVLAMGADVAGTVQGAVSVHNVLARARGFPWTTSCALGVA